MTTEHAASVELAERIARLLRDRHETVAVAESSAGGRISAALLAIPGASRYFLGGAVAYTTTTKERLAGVTPAGFALGRAATEIHAIVLARAIRERLDATWGIGETGAAGPTGNRYGDAPGHCCLAVVGSAERSATIETGAADRDQNMHAFTAAALQLLLAALDTEPASLPG